MIELLSTAPQEIDGSIGIGKIADHLLRSGVIVPPCKVGGYMYTISRGRPKKWKVCFIGHNTLGEQKYHLADEGYKHMIEAWNYDLGKTVFLSREEAERALKERREADHETTGGTAASGDDAAKEGGGCGAIS
ncbi:MAG: hypothetical protein IJD10_07730 [Clostridia bacterium]|nr:hypothetical protein [Clostridia bacterium]